MGRGRPPSGPRLVDRLEGSTGAKARLKAVIETVAGERTVEEACAALGVSEAVFHRLRARLLGAALSEAEPKRRGRRPEAVPENQGEVEALRDENRELKMDLEASRIREELAVVMPRVLKPRAEAKKKGRRQRRRKAAREAARQATEGGTGPAAAPEASAGRDGPAAEA